MVRASAIPISVDFSELDELAGTPEVIARAAKIRASLGDPKILMLGMDRLDYTKGIRHRLKAYEELLQDKEIAPPEVTLMQVALPSRERVKANAFFAPRSRARSGGSTGSTRPSARPPCTTCTTSTRVPRWWRCSWPPTSCS